MSILIITTSVIILITAVLIAFASISTGQKALICIVGCSLLGIVLLTPVGVLAGIIAPGTANPAWKDMLLGGFFCGSIGLIVGMLSGLIAFGLSILIKHIFSEKIERQQVL